MTCPVIQERDNGLASVRGVVLHALISYLQEIIWNLLKTYN